MMNQLASRILLVGGDPQWAGKLSPHFGGGWCLVRAGAKRRGGLQSLHQHPFDLVLADWDSPEGPALLRRLKEHPPAAVTLFIALIGADDTAAKLRAFELGALDCINKADRNPPSCARVCWPRWK